MIHPVLRSTWDESVVTSRGFESSAEGENKRYESVLRVQYMSGSIRSLVVLFAFAEPVACPLAH